MDSQTDKVRKILDRYKKMKADKQPFINLYRLIGKYVMTRKQNFDGDRAQGEILTAQVFDGTAGRCVQLAASSLLGALFPNAGKTFRIAPPDHMPQSVAESQEVKDFYKRCNDRMSNIMDNPRAGLNTSLIEYMTDQVSFGISGIGVFENEDETDKTIPIRYVPIDCKKMCIAEGPDTFVDTIYIEYEMTVKQLVQRYKYENVSPQSQKSCSEDPGKKVKVLHAIEPRIDQKANLFGSDNMPWGSIHIEIDHNHQIGTDSGYWDMPVLVTRFWKAMGEIYGRSPASEAMPDILEANLFREASIVATEKMLNPPLAVNDPDILGRGKLRTGAGEINVRKMGGRQMELGNRPAVEPIVTINELQSTYKRIEELRMVIEQAFFIDQFKDLGNGSTRITAEQARMLYEFRGQNLGTIYSRQIAELFTPLIDRTFNICINRGIFGAVPDSDMHYMAIAQQEEIELIPDVIMEMTAKGEEIYKVEYISPAKRIMEAEEMMGIERMTLFLTSAQPLQPNVIDNVDFDDLIRRVQERTGSPSSIIKSMEVVRQMRQEQAKQQAAMMEMQAAAVGAESARNAGQAVQAFSKAGQAA